MAITADKIPEAWVRAMRDTPVNDYSPLAVTFGWQPRRSYRERLDAPKRNWWGQVIPQRTIVLQNIARLKQGGSYRGPNPGSL